MKGVVEVVCAGLNVTGIRFAPLAGPDVPYLRSGRAAQISADSEVLGTLGELSREVMRNFGMKQAAYCFDLNFDLLVGLVSEEKRSEALPRFPATTRDIALIADDHLEAQGVLDFVEGLGEKLIEEVEIFDVFKGSPIPQGKKSLALRFTYRSFERNLTDGEVNAIHEAVTHKVLKQFNAQLPPA
jgi:phenylalanyl-tRNA synthetase beta chain